MSQCCVEGCQVPSDDENDDVTYFQFPINRTLKKKWSEAIGSTTSKVGVNSVVCSQHFTDEDYEDYRGGRRLRSLVVPSVFALVTDSNNLKDLEPNNEPAVENEDPPSNNKRTEEQRESVDERRQTRSNTNHDRHDEVTERKKELEENESVSRKTLDNVSRKKSKKHRKKRKLTSDSSGSDSDEDPKTNRRRHAKKETRKRRRNSTNKVESETANGDDKASIDFDDETTAIDLVEPIVTAAFDGETLIADVAAAANVASSIPDEREGRPEDIEELLTNYHIQTNNSIPLCVEAVSEERPGEGASECIDLDTYKEETPVFIEVPVDKVCSDNLTPQTDNQHDCLMLLESVQCEVDPSALMLPELRPTPEPEPEPAEKPDPISLLTSSDEDEVIIQEPNIDTVEVSDEDEDDLPLLSLVRPKAEKLLEQNLNNLMWGVMDYYCYRCKFTTVNHGEYDAHVKSSCSLAIHVCDSCNYTTASKLQFARHKRKHKEERRYRCHICNYNARHNMSLIYHLKSHEVTKLKRVKKGFKCEKCNFVSDVKLKVLRHVRLCMSDKCKYRCEECNYETSRQNDFKRHQERKHHCNDTTIL